MNLGMLASYDQAKQMLTELNGDNFGTKLASSAVSGFSCAFASLPFDLIKSRLMNMKVHCLLFLHCHLSKTTSKLEDSSSQFSA
jgi:hypothetical protein